MEKVLLETLMELDIVVSLALTELDEKSCGWYYQLKEAQEKASKVIKQSISE
jgi:hypothetical protein